MSSVPNDSGHKLTQRSSDVVDRISNLPESLLSHILSLLPTADAVSTSLLSTKWKFVWRNIHNLSFIDRNRIRPQENRDRLLFGYFVNNVFIFLNEKCIDKFSLDIKRYSAIYNVTTWISAAVSRNAKVIEFCTNDYYGGPLYQMPSSLITTKTLEVLSLDGFNIRLNVPSLVSLPNLKTLKLSKVFYQCGESVRNLISGCSSLETLYILRFPNDNVLTFTISSPTLKKLTLCCYRELDASFPERHFKLEIKAPQLRHLNLIDNFVTDFSVENLCLLDEARIDVCILQDGFRYDKAVVKLLQGLHNVKNLSVKGETLKCLISHGGAYPVFSRLTQLTVEANYPEWSLLLNLVEGMNKLESLTLEKGDFYSERTLVGWRKPEKVPICFLSCLKTISISDFEDVEDVCEIVAYILKNAECLREITIKAADRLNSKDRYRLLQKVSKFPRASRECEFTFS